MSDKTKLIKQLKDSGITIPKGATVSDLRHRLTYWESGKGYLLRLALPSSRKPDSPATLLQQGIVYWIPNSEFARMIAKTKLVFMMGRSEEAPVNSTILDVPKDFNDRWGIGVIDGSN